MLNCKGDRSKMLNMVRGLYQRHVAIRDLAIFLKWFLYYSGILSHREIFIVMGYVSLGRT